MCNNWKVKNKTAIPKKNKSATGRVVFSSFTNIYFRIFLLLFLIKIIKMISDFFYGLGDIFESLWTIMPSIGNIPNDISIIVISAFFIYWTVKLVQFKRNGEA